MLRLLALLAALLLALPALAQTRHALVIGIDSYAALDDLSRARADAVAMEQLLQGLGFRVETLLDPSRRELMFALIDLQGRIAPGDTVAVFFAGHGVEDGGRNFLLPADTPALRDRADLPGAAVALGDLRDMLHLRRPGVVLMFIDACRDNPLPTDASGTRSVGGSRGLARPETAQGTFILFAAAARQAARDHLGPADPDPNSVFTRVLLRELARPGLSIQEVAQRTGLEVTRLAAAAGFTQRPEYMDGILAPFRLREGAPTPRPDSCANARPVWSLIQNSENAEALEGFAATYATSCPALAALAQERLDDLAQEREDALDTTGMTAAQMNSRGVDYGRGRGVTQSDERAARWYRAAAEAGSIAAMRNLGIMYRDGRGVAQSDAQAVRWFRAGAEGGNTAAMHSLGVKYRQGRGVAQSDVQTVRWYRAAAEAGNTAAMHGLGVMYRQGRGVAQSDAQAVRWFRAAAEAGNAASKTNLGFMYENGLGAAQSDTQAMRWFRAATEAGDALGMRNLGVLYEEGRGVMTRDPVRAAELFLAAARGGETWVGEYAARRHPDTIHEMHRLLAEAGEYRGAPDARWGPASLRALESYAARR